MSGLSKYIESSGRLPEDALLGYIAFTTGADGEHDRDALVAEFEQLGLDAKQVPPTATAVNAFKKATARAQDAKYRLSPQVEAAVQFRTVASATPAEVDLRVIMREKRIDSRQALGWDRIGELRLYRPQRRGRRIDESSARLHAMLVPGLTDLETARLRRVLADVQHDYTRFRLFLDGVKVRAMILNYIRSLDGVSMLRSSTHFVPVAHAAELHKLAEAIGTLEGCRITLIPLVDLGEQREQILEAFRLENEKDLASLVADMQEAGEKVTPLVFSQLRERYDALKGRADHYADILDTSIARTSGAMDLATQSLSVLGQRLLKKGV